MLLTQIEELQRQLQKQASGGPEKYGEAMLTTHHALSLQNKLKEFRLRIDLMPNIKTKDNDIQREFSVLRSLLG